MTIIITGNWKKGTAYDFHILKSNYIGVDNLGHNIYDTTRTEMGELVYQLKHQNQKSLVVKIVDLLEKFKGIKKLDAIIPMPQLKKAECFSP